MDPDAALQRWLRARADGDRAEAREAKADLLGWLRGGGFPPKWSADVRAAFYGKRRQRRNPRRRNGGGGAASMLLGVGVLAGLVYLVARAAPSSAPRLAGVYDRIPG